MILTRDRGFYRDLAALAVPISLQNLVTFAVGFLDNLMIGTLGDHAISGVYMGNQPQVVLQMFTSGIGGAIIVLAAQYWGKRDVRAIKRLVTIGVHLSMVVGLLFSAIAVALPAPIIRIFTPDAGVIAEGAAYLRIVGASYVFFCLSQVLISSMRAVESAKIGLKVSVLALVTNAFFNYVMIFGKLGFPAMGVRGAAWATLISRILEAAVMVWYVLRADDRLAYRLKELLTIDKDLLRDFVRYGAPVVGGSLVWSVNLLVNSMVLGRYSAEVISATSIAGMLSNLSFVWITGLSSAVGVITGKTVGAGLEGKMREYAKTVQILFLGVGIATGALLLAICEPYLGLYQASPEALGYARQFIWVLSVSIVGSSYQAACLAGLVKSGGDVGFVFKNDSIFVFGVVLPSAIISAYLGAPPWVVFACLKCDQILKCFVAVWKINKFDWMKNLTRSQELPREQNA